MTSEFAIAVHVLVFLAEQHGQAVSSQTLAGSVGTNPSFIRRVLGQLGKAGLTVGIEGKGGGSTLAKPAAAISLGDVYRAVDADRELIPLHPSPHPMCKVGRSIKGVLRTTIVRVESAVNHELDSVTVADVLADVLRRTP